MGAEKPRIPVMGHPETYSISLREDNANVKPTYFLWQEGVYSKELPMFFIDGQIKHPFIEEKDRKCIALLVEPRGLHPENYEFIEKNHDKFHKVLTYDRELLDAIPNGLFYPLGGSSIAFEDWGIYPKTKDVCMIVSEKNTMPGHKLRNEIVKEFEGRIDFYGAGVGKPFERKFDVLKDYEWVIVVESEARKDYFTEKIIDPISVGCNVLYCGKCKIGYFLHTRFNSLNSLKVFFPYLSGTDKIFKEHNLHQAKKYRIAEDWIWEHYQELFT